MADDWDTVTKIGSKARGGASQRETVVRGKSALNAAQRSGTIIGTEKKMGAGNSVSKPGVEGQRLTKIDRSEDIVPLQKVERSVAKTISDTRQAMKPSLTQKDLATKCNVRLADITAFENGSARPDNNLMIKIEKALNVHLRGANIGNPLKSPKEEVVKKTSSK